MNLRDNSPLCKSLHGKGEVIDLYTTLYTSRTTAITNPS